MTRKAVYGLIIAAAVFLSGMFCPPGTVAAATVTEVAEQTEQTASDNTAVEITYDINLEMEDAPIQKSADNAQNEKQIAEQAVARPTKIKAPSYGAGGFHDAIEARWATNKVFPYNPNNVYKIYCRPGYITDLALKEGETITYIGAGDTVQWVIDTTTANGAPHVYIKPVREGVSANLIINTNKHSYQLLLASVDWYIPMVSWSYWVEDEIALIERLEQERENRMREQKEMIFEWEKNYRYKIKAQGKKPAWTPKKVHDDGVRTFIQFNDLSKEAPVLFILDGKQKKPANYRIQGNSFVVDGVFKKIVLMYGKKTVVITNQGGDQDE
jgi:type IV secretion system protein VirB9